MMEGRGNRSEVESGLANQSFIYTYRISVATFPTFLTSVQTAATSPKLSRILISMWLDPRGMCCDHYQARSRS